MWIASKLLWAAVQPLSWMVATGLLAALFVILDRRKLAVASALFTPALLLILAFTQLAPWSIGRLEQLTPTPTEIPADAAGVIVLGGMVQLHAGQEPVPAMVDASERFLTGLVLARQLPADRPLVITGASRSFFGPEEAEAIRLERLARALGYEGRIVVEPKAENTCAHAPEIAKLLPQAPGQTWLLVTSAYHLPRAIACFKAAGWTGVVGYPTDFLADSQDPRSTVSAWMTKLVVFNRTIRERLGLVLYKLAGRIA